MNSLGINKPKKETRVVVAMSGGVDSSVVAALMKQEGYDVTGITLKLYDDSKQSKEGRQCCAGQDILDAKRVSESININHKILFYQKMELNFLNQTDKPKKCECIVFCQKVIHTPLTLSKFVENCQENKIYVISFLMFTLMCFIFFSGNKYCREFDLY